MLKKIKSTRQNLAPRVNSSKHSPKSAILDRGLKPKKSFGQNFMINDSINAILLQAAASLGTNNPVLEIGAGTGSLTAHLLKEFALTHAVERDRDLIPILREHFSLEIDEHKLQLHEADGARFDLASIFSSQKPGIMVGNLPYHLTSSIVILALKNYQRLKGAVFLVQKEVADRLTAAPGTKDYGFLTALLNLAFVLEKVAIVGRNAFWPAPRVDSAIIKLSVLDRGISSVADIGDLLIFVRSIFQKRRKKLSTILAGQLSRDDFLKLGIDPNARPEELDAPQFLAMYNRAAKLRGETSDA